MQGLIGWIGKKLTRKLPSTIYPLHLKRWKLEDTDMAGALAEWQRISFSNRKRSLKLCRCSFEAWIICSLRISSVTQLSTWPMVFGKIWRTKALFTLPKLCRNSTDICRISGVCERAMSAIKLDLISENLIRSRAIPCNYGHDSKK